jgi:dynein heavy chain
MPIDTVQFDFVQVDHLTMEIIKAPPEDGCYIRGLFLEGARWEYTKHVLADSRPKELYIDLPIMWLNPKQFRKPSTSGIYQCPVYKSLLRAGIYSSLIVGKYLINIQIWIKFLEYIFTLAIYI